MGDVVHFLVCRSDGTEVVARSLDEFLRGRGYEVIFTATVQEALTAAQNHKPVLALIPARVDETVGALELMQRLSLLGVPVVIINGHGTGYNAAEDNALAQALSRIARRGSENGNGRHH